MNRTELIELMAFALIKSVPCTGDPEFQLERETIGDFWRDQAKSALTAIEEAGMVVVDINDMSDARITAMENFAKNYNAGVVGGRNDYRAELRRMLSASPAAKHNEVE